MARVLDRCKNELEWLERDVSKLVAGDAAGPTRASTTATRSRSSRPRGTPSQFGDDFGGDEETALSDDSGKPTMITRYPTAIKAFYMEPDADDPARALAVDMIAPEGYGEIIGG